MATRTARKSRKTTPDTAETPVTEPAEQFDPPQGRHGVKAGEPQPTTPDPVVSVKDAETVTAETETLTVETTAEPTTPEVVEPVAKADEPETETVQGEGEGQGEGGESEVVQEGGEPDTSLVLVEKKKLNLHEIGAQKRVGGGHYLFSSDLEPGDHNTRVWSDPENIAAIRDMADTMLASMNAGQPAVHMPLKYVQQDYYEGDKIKIDEGQIRWRAVLYLEGREYIPSHFVDAVVEPDTIPIPVIPGNPIGKVQQVEWVVNNLMNNKPKPLELARAFARMSADNNMTQMEIAESIGKKGQQSYVSQIMSLNHAPDDVQEFIATGRIASTTVIKAMAKHGDDAIAVIRDAVKAEEQKPPEDRADIVNLDDHRPKTSTTTRPTPARTNSGQAGRGRSRSGGRTTSSAVSGKAGDAEAAAFSLTAFKRLLAAIREEIQGDWASEKTKAHLDAELKEIGLPSVLKKKTAA
jgi:hypothetical protein